MHRRKRGRIVIWIRYPKGWRLLLACCALGVLASIIAAETWYPKRYDFKDGLKSGTFSLGMNAAFNLVKEIFKK